MYAGVNPSVFMAASGTDELGRFFLLKNEVWWSALTLKHGFHIIETEAAADGLGRAEVSWLNIVAKKT